MPDPPTTSRCALPRRTTPPRDTALGRDEASSAALLALIYEQLHALAEQWFASQPANHTLQPTALINEVYLRLAAEEQPPRRTRTHFFALAARVMRQVLIDHARRRAATKRGGAWGRVTLAHAAHAQAGVDVDVIALHEALEKLEGLSPRQCRVVELRFLAGLTVDETAEALGISPRTVKLDWRMARAWLRGELRRGG